MRQPEGLAEVQVDACVALLQGIPGEIPASEQLAAPYRRRQQHLLVVILLLLVEGGRCLGGRLGGRLGEGGGWCGDSGAGGLDVAMAVAGWCGGEGGRGGGGGGAGVAWTRAGKGIVVVVNT